MKEQPSDLSSQHDKSGNHKRNDQIQHHCKAALDQHGFSRLYIRDTLHALDHPDLTVTYPQPVKHNAVEPVHNHKKEIGLEICRFEIGNVVPHGNDLLIEAGFYIM